MLSEAQECQTPSHNALVNAWRWFVSWFAPPPPPCDENEQFIERFFSLGIWLDGRQREQLLAELATRSELKQGGPKEQILEYMKKNFADIMTRLEMELKDVAPVLSFLNEAAWPPSRIEADAATPVIVVPGVSSSCEGLLSYVVKFLQHYLNTEHVECIAEGDTTVEQVISSWFSGGEDAVEHFRQRVLANPVYAERGFNVLAFSQGNFITRGYVQQYNGMAINGQLHPMAKSWVAMNGPVLGQGGIPGVDNSNWWGASLDGIASIACDNVILGNVLTPCAYLRIPGAVASAGYRGRLLAKLNGEDLCENPTLAEREAQEHFLLQSKENINRLESFVAVKNRGDTVIKPLEAQWLGIYGGSFEEVISFEQTKFYREDTFGLAALHQRGGVHFVETPGELEHCMFSTDDLKGWVDAFWDAPRL